MLYCKKQGEEATVMPNDSFSFISERLYALMDEKYKKFQCSLIPTVDPERVLGVRVPELRKIAREFWSAGQTSEFMRTLPHKTYEEDNIHGFLIERITDFDKAICELDIFCRTWITGQHAIWYDRRYLKKLLRAVSQSFGMDLKRTHIYRAVCRRRSYVFQT